MLAVSGEKRSYDTAFQGDEDQVNSIPSNGRKCMSKIVIMSLSGRSVQSMRKEDSRWRMDKQ